MTEDFPTNLQQLKILKFLKNTRSASVPEISLETELPPNQVQENLQSLERQGFVKKPWLAEYAYKITYKGLSAVYKYNTTLQ